MTMDDLLKLSDKFWDFHRDPIVSVDGGAFTIMTIQYNLCAGTIARYAVQQPDMISLVEDLLRFRKHGQFLMTEVGHGIDMANIETSATLLPSGEFILHTPNPQAAKCMPPTLPAGRPCIAVVFARLIVGKEDRGIRPFVVALNDGNQMCTGVTARLFPERGGASPVNHAVTAFNNVRLPSNSLLGSFEKPASAKANMVQATWRIAVGSMALGCLAIPMMQTYATIGAMYSLRRHVGPPENRIPIIHFRTQQIPILTTTAQVYVMEAFARWATKIFRDTSLDTRVRHGIAAVLKAVMVQHSQASAIAISDRCGAQGLFAHNQITSTYGVMRGIAIAEGDILALSIRLVSELLQGRYKLPAARDASSFLARHEMGLFEEKRVVMASAKHHRGDETNRLVLPYCVSMVEAIGHRMAYEAAVAEGVQPELIDLYVASVVKLDAAWYIEHAQLGRHAQQEMETVALDAVLPHLGSLIRGMQVESYITAPIVSDDKWNHFMRTLQVFEGNAEVPLWRDRFRIQDFGWSALPVVMSFL